MQFGGRASERPLRPLIESGICSLDLYTTVLFSVKTANFVEITDTGYTLQDPTDLEKSWENHGKSGK